MIYLLALLALTGGELAASASLAGTIEVDAGEPIVLRCTIEIPDGWDAIIDWDVDKPAHGREFENGEYCCVWTPWKAGVYEATVDVVMGKVVEGRINFQKKKQVYRLKVRGPPQPVPDIKPDVGPDQPPSPKPDPTAGPVAHVLILRDQATQKQETTQELISLRLTWKDNFPRGPPNEPQIWEHDDPQAKVKAWSRKLPAGAAPPYCFLVDDDGDIVDQFQFTTAADVIKRCRTTK